MGLYLRCAHELRSFESGHYSSIGILLGPLLQVLHGVMYADCNDRSLDGTVSYGRVTSPIYFILVMCNFGFGCLTGSCAEAV
jgi:hypothetical protein